MGKVKLSPEAKSRLNHQLVKLGDMMGDGLHHEKDGKWIEVEYKKVAKQLGLIPKKDRTKRIELIDTRMKQRVAEVKCGECGGHLIQTRSGSKRAQCQSCKSLWKLLK